MAPGVGTGDRLGSRASFDKGFNMAKLGPDFQKENPSWHHCSPAGHHRCFNQFLNLYNQFILPEVYASVFVKVDSPALCLLKKSLCLTLFILSFAVSFLQLQPMENYLLCRASCDVLLLNHACTFETASQVLPDRKECVPTPRLPLFKIYNRN